MLHALAQRPVQACTVFTVKEGPLPYGGPYNNSIQWFRLYYHAHVQGPSRHCARRVLHALAQRPVQAEQAMAATTLQSTTVPKLTPKTVLSQAGVPAMQELVLQV